MEIIFRKYPCKKCGCNVMTVETKKAGRGERYLLYCSNCKAFVQYANEDQKIVLRNLKRKE